MGGTSRPTLCRTAPTWSPRRSGPHATCTCRTKATATCAGGTKKTQDVRVGCCSRRDDDEDDDDALVRGKARCVRLALWFGACRLAGLSLPSALGARAWPRPLPA